MSLNLPPLSHYMDDPQATTPPPPPSPTKKKSGLARSRTLTSRIKRTVTPPSSSSLQRSHSVSTGRPRQTEPLPLPPPLPVIANLQQDGHWDDTAPWEMYFDPNYTFFGGTVLDPRQRKRQQDVLKAMALNDYHLHLHPPPSAAASTAADQLQQPSLPYTVMDAVHHQHYASSGVDPPPPPPQPPTMEENMSPTSIQTIYYPAESSPTDMKKQDHQARLALLHAIRTESYQPITTTPMVQDNNNKSNVTTTTTTTTVAPPCVAAVAATATNHRQRRYPDPSRYIWMETPSPTQEEKTHSSSTFDLTSFQETGQASSPHKPNTPLPPPHSNLTTTTTTTTTTKERRYRTSFLYFAFGFLFPPVWVIGALYTPPEHQQAYQSTRGRRIDLMWKRACRMAFALFTFGLLVMVVIMLALDPGALGWRTSRTDLSSAQQFIPVVSQ